MGPKHRFACKQAQSVPENTSAFSQLDVERALPNLFHVNANLGDEILANAAAVGGHVGDAGERVLDRKDAAQSEQPRVQLDGSEEDIRDNF